MQTTFNRNFVRNTQQSGTAEITAQAVRVEPVYDPALNQRLFHLYCGLIAPVRGVEQTAAKIENCRTRIDELKNWNFVPRFADFLIKAALAVALFFAMIPLYNRVVYGISDALAAGGHRMLRGLFELGCIPLYFLFVLCLGGLLGNWLHHLINRTLRPCKKGEIEQEEQHILALQQRIQQTVAQLSQALALVPPAYRNSDALSYFVNAYQNSRVDNLKEAVNAYEAHLEAEKTRALIRQQIALLNQIQYQNELVLNQLDVLCAKMDGLRSDVWLANAVY